METPVTFLKQTNTEMNITPIEDGNVIFNTTDKKIYLDDEGKRLQYGGSVTVDSQLSETSTNPVQNKVITAKFNEIFNKIIDSLDDIVSNVTSKKFAGALALKELYNKLTGNGGIKGYEVRKGDGVYITYTDGADTVTKKLGSEPQLLYSNVGNGQYDIASKAQNYQTLTKNNFIIALSGWSARCNSGSPDGTNLQPASVSTNGTLSYAYDASSGKLNISGLSNSNTYWESHRSWYYTVNGSATVNIYLIG